MSTRTTSVQDAIKTGLKEVGQPADIIFYSGIGLCILLMCVDFSWWYLVLIPSAALVSTIYVNRATAKWKIWAYDNVCDIHQLQRSAELAQLLARGSHERANGLMSSTQRETLKTLQERFHCEAVFVNDPLIPNETRVFYSGSGSIGVPALVLNEEGIWTESEGYLAWGQIKKERIPVVSYSGIRPGGGKAGASSEYVFRFDHPNGCFEMPLSSLQIKVWELDLLLYIYRGRYALAQLPADKVTNS